MLRVHCTQCVICFTNSDLTPSDTFWIGYGCAVALATTGICGVAKNIGARNSANASAASAIYREGKAALPLSGIYIRAPPFSRIGPARLISSTGPDSTICDGELKLA